MKLLLAALDLQRPSLVAAALAAQIALCACTGDDTAVALPDAATADASTPDGSMPMDAGGDGPSADGDATISALDAAPEAGDAETSADSAPLPTLACATWRYASPVVLEDLTLQDAQGIYGGSLWVGEANAGELSVVAQPPGTTFRVYSLAKATRTTSSFDGPSLSFQATLASVKYDTPSTASRILEVVVEAASTDGLAVYLVPDSATSTAMVPPPVMTAAGGGSAAVLPLSSSQLFVAQETSAFYEGTNILYTISVGLTPAALTELDTSVNDDVFLSPHMVHANGEMYLFSTNELEDLGAFSWAVPDTAVVPAPPVTPRAFDTGEIGFMVDLAQGGAANTTNFAYYTLPASRASFTLDVGQVPNADLGSVTAASLSRAVTITDLTLAPMSGVTNAQWSGDDIAVVGGGSSLTDGGTSPGVTFLWANAGGYIRALESGPSALLRSETSPIGQVVAAPASVSATSAAWDVVWIESRPGGDVLLYDELDCELAE